MSNYDDWKGRAPEDDGPQEEPQEEQMNEAEYAVYDAERAFNDLVDQWGEICAQRLMFAIFLRQGLRTLKRRAAKPGVKENLQ